MPANCSADVQAVIAHIDKTFTSRNATAIQALKDNWGLGVMTHLDDVAGARESTPSHSNLGKRNLLLIALLFRSSSSQQLVGLAVVTSNERARHSVL